MTTVLTPKRPAEAVKYVFDLTKELQGDTITTFTLVVTSGTVVVNPTPMNDGQAVWAVISGGANGETATLELTVQTGGLQTLITDYSLYVGTGAEAVNPSTGTKRQAATMAFVWMGLPGYEFDATPEEWASLLLVLDMVMAEWRTSGLDLGYNFPTVIGHSDLSDAIGIPDDALSAAALTLAMRGAPGIGKTISAEARVAYSQAMVALRARYTPKVVRQLQLGTPRGAGQKPYGVWWPFGYAGSSGP